MANLQDKLKKLYEKGKQLFGLLLVLYPAIQIILKSKGIDLPDLGPELNFGSQALGTAALAQSDKIVKKKEEF